MRLNKIRLQERINTQKGSKHNVYQVTLPKGIIKSLGWKKGDVLNVRKGTDGITIKKRNLEGAV